MKVRLADEKYSDEFVGFMQRARCIVVGQGDGLYEIFLAHDLPPRLARAELTAYLTIWERTAPGAEATLLDDEIS
jgi:hypothetical protein